jgi:hypothetical protein
MDKYINFKISTHYMLDKIKSGLDCIADFYRTAPLGETIFLMNAVQITWNYDEPFTLGMNFLGSLAGVLLAAKQFRLKQRLESSIQKHGYDDGVFKKTLPEWCDRQTARVVVKKYGNLDEYESLCQDNKYRMGLSNLFNL